MVFGSFSASVLFFVQGIQGTGMDGRIVSRDVLGATPTATPTTIAPGAEFTDIDLTSMRKARTIQYICGNEDELSLLS